MTRKVLLLLTAFATGALAGSRVDVGRQRYDAEEVRVLVEANNAKSAALSRIAEAIGYQRYNQSPGAIADAVDIAVAKTRLRLAD